jgi:hypothetical protein
MFLRSHPYGEYLTRQIKVNKQFSQLLPKLSHRNGLRSTPRYPKLEILVDKKRNWHGVFSRYFGFPPPVSSQQYSLLILSSFTDAVWSQQLTASFINTRKLIIRRSQWPRGLRRGIAAACLLGVWVRNSQRHGCPSLIIVVCCQAEISASGWSLVQRSPTECCVSECDHVSSIIRRPWPTGAVSTW